MDIQRHAAGKWMSDAVTCGGLVYVSGTIARDVTLDARQQTMDVLEQIDERLRLANSSRDRLLFVNIWLTSRDDFIAMNEAWEQWLGAAPRPARATVESALMLPHLKVEIAAVAAVFNSD